MLIIPRYAFVIDRPARQRSRFTTLIISSKLCLESPFHSLAV